MSPPADSLSTNLRFPRGTLKTSAVFEISLSSDSSVEVQAESKQSDARIGIFFVNSSDDTPSHAMS